MLHLLSVIYMTIIGLGTSHEHILFLQNLEPSRELPEACISAEMLWDIKESSRLKLRTALSSERVFKEYDIEPEHKGCIAVYRLINGTVPDTSLSRRKTL